MLWWTLPLFLIVAIVADNLFSWKRATLSGKYEEKLAIVLLAPIMPILEEVAFRWIPLTMFGYYVQLFDFNINTHYSGLIAMIAFTIVWVLIHFKPRYLLFYSIMGAYLCYLWYINMGWLAISVHVLWNVINCIVLLKVKNPELANYNFREPSIATVMWNSKEIGRYRSWIWKIKSLMRS